MNDDWESGGNHLASWVVRLSAKGEALRGQRRSDLRQVAIVTCAKSAAEIALFNEQKSFSRRNIGLNATTPNHQHITRLRRKRFHSSGHTSSTSSTCSSLSMDYGSDSESIKVRLLVVVIDVVIVDLFFASKVVFSGHGPLPHHQRRPDQCLHRRNQTVSCVTKVLGMTGMMKLRKQN